MVLRVSVDCRRQEERPAPRRGRMPCEGRPIVTDALGDSVFLRTETDPATRAGRRAFTDGTRVHGADSDSWLRADPPGTARFRTALLNNSRTGRRVPRLILTQMCADR